MKSQLHASLYAIVLEGIPFLTLHVGKRDLKTAGTLQYSINKKTEICAALCRTWYLSYTEEKTPSSQKLLWALPSVNLVSNLAECQWPSGEKVRFCFIKEAKVV